MSLNKEVLKLLMMGESNVGKSNIILRFTQDEFYENLQNTIFVDYVTKHITIDGDTVKLAIWDTAGHERFRTLSSNYYRGGQGALLVYDVTDKTSFMKLETWIQELNIYFNETDIIKMVVGNKIDLPNREVSTEEGLQFARTHQALYIESSAKTADGINGCFEKLAQKILQRPYLWDRYTPCNGNMRSVRHEDQGGIQLAEITDSEVHFHCYCTLI